MYLGPTSQKSSPGATLLLPGRGGEPGKGLRGLEGASSFFENCSLEDLEEAARLLAAEGPLSFLTWALLGCSLLGKAFLGVS